MFKNSITLSDVSLRLDDINDRTQGNGFYMYQLAEISNGLEVQSRSSSFGCGPSTDGFAERLELEYKRLNEFVAKFGPSGNDTLLVFEGSRIRDPARIFKLIASTMDYEALDLQVLDDESGLYDAAFREHFYFLGFPDKNNQRLFTMAYAGQDLSNETE